MESRSWWRSKKQAERAGKILKITLLFSLCYSLHSDRSIFHGSMFLGILRLVNVSKMCFELKISYTGSLKY